MTILAQNGCYGKGTHSRSIPIHVSRQDVLNGPAGKKANLEEQVEMVSRPESMHIVTDVEGDRTRHLWTPYNGTLNTYTVQLWNFFRTQSLHFIELYVTYCYYRRRGWVPKSGLKYGVQYVLYKGSPEVYHSSYGVLVRSCEGLGSRDGDYTPGLRWQDVVAASRVSESVGKDLVICSVMRVTTPTNGEEGTLELPNCARDFVVHEVTAAVEASYEPNKFDVLCDTVNSSLMMLDHAVHEFLDLKDELLKHTLPSQLLLQLTLISAKVFRSFSDLCVPVGELSRLVKLHSAHLEEAMEPMKRLLELYAQKQNQLSIALKRIEMMAMELNQCSIFIATPAGGRITHERRLNGWLKLFMAVMSTRSHGRRWKFRIEPLKAKIKQGFNPHALDESDEEGEEKDKEEEENDEQDNASENNDGDMPHSSMKLGSVRKVTQRLGLESHSARITFWCSYFVQGGAPEMDVCCTISLEDQYFTSQVFSAKPLNSSGPPPHQDFSFLLSDEAAMTLQPHPLAPLKSSVIPKLSIAVYPRSITADMAAHTSLELRSLTLTATPPTDYPLHCSVEDEDPPAMPLVCHRVKVVRHSKMNSETSTIPGTGSWLSWATPLYRRWNCSPVECLLLSWAPWHKIETLSSTLAKVRADKAREIEQLEQGMHWLHPKKSKVSIYWEVNASNVTVPLLAFDDRASRSSPPSEIRKLIVRKQKPQLNQRLPEWGSSLPDNFFERLQLFAEESVQKHGELTERIRRKVREVCEKQLATQHRLAPPLPLSADSAMEDVSLPALFMPTPRNLIFNPRAHQYFHPSGSTDRGIPTLNLFHLSQQYAQRLESLYHSSPGDLEQS
eukprot:Em0011g937a